MKRRFIKKFWVIRSIKPPRFTSKDIGYHTEVNNKPSRFMSKDFGHYTKVDNKIIKRKIVCLFNNKVALNVIPRDT